MNIHDVKSITIKAPVTVNGHSWRQVTVECEPIVHTCEDGEWHKVKTSFSFSMHSAEEDRPIDIKVEE
jgi:hypothetical protein